MTKQTEEIFVKYTSDTSNVEKNATKATAALEDMTGSVADLGDALKQTGEASIDTATGISGLGGVITGVADKAVKAAKGLSTFSKALLATGIGAAIAGIAALVVYWEDIAEFIGIADDNLRDFNEATDRQISKLEKRLKIETLLGAEQGRQLEISKQIAEIEATRVLTELNEATALLQKRQYQADRIEGLFGSAAAVEEQAEIVAQLRLDWELATAQVTAYERAISDLDKETPDDEPAGGDPAKSNVLSVSDEFIVEPLNDPYLDSLSALLHEEARLRTKLAEDTANETTKIYDEATAQQLKATQDAIKAAEKAQRDANRAALEDAALTEEGKRNLLFGTSALLQTVAAENQQIVGAIQVSEAIANTAVAITKVAPNPFAIAGVVAIGAAQVATIVKQMNVSSTDQANATGFDEVQREPTEIFRQGERTNTTQPVLVLEDFYNTANRVNVTDNRARIGNRL